MDISGDEVDVIGACRNPHPIQRTIKQAQDPDGVIAAYDWDFDDGSPPATAAARSRMTSEFRALTRSDARSLTTMAA